MKAEGEEGRGIGSFTGCLEEVCFACLGDRVLPSALSSPVSVQFG